MPAEYVTVYSEFFRWILRDTQENLEPMALNELLKKYTSDQKLQLKLKQFSSYMLSRMHKLEGFTVLQKVHILFLINEKPCLPFRNQMMKAGEYRMNGLKQIQWFCSNDGTFKLERQGKPLRMSPNIQNASRFFRYIIGTRGNAKTPSHPRKHIRSYLRYHRSKNLFKNVYSILNEGNLIEGFSLLENIHIFFLYSRPINEVFETKIREAGEYELDERRRIIHFRSSDGGFERRSVSNQEKPKGNDDREEERDEMDLDAGNEMPDDSDQGNIRQELEHEGLDPGPVEDMNLDFEPEPREPTIQIENRQEVGQGRLAPEPISNEPLESAQMAQNEQEFMPVFISLAEPMNPAVKQELPEDLNPIFVKEEVEGQEAKPILIEPPSAIHLLTLIRNLIWTINSPTLNDLLRKVEVKMAKPGIEDIKIPFVDIKAAALHGLGNLFKSASAMLPPDFEPVDLSQILLLFNLMLSMIELPQDCSIFTKINEFISTGDDKEVSMEKVEFAIGCMVQAATLN